ncbi:MAG: methyl-accepting chemotaxis protein [Magnetococcus sp. YQC-5]
MEQQFNDLAELSGDLYCTVDAEGQITSVSRTITSLYGYTAEDVKNKPIESFLCTKQYLNRSDQLTVEKAFQGHPLVEFPMVIPHKNGSLLESMLSVVPVYDSDGKLTGFYCSVILLTQEYLMEQAIKQRIHLVYGERGSDDKGFLNVTFLLDTILQEQLQAVTRVTEEAAFNLLSQIQAVDAQLGTVMEFLVQNDAATRSQGVDAQQAIEEDRAAIDNLRQFVADIQKRKEEERERGMRVLQEIQGLGGFVSIVHEISDRTNVLALNAGIIAARAGEHGTQFAVVASEVRKLSRQVKNAAEEIGKGIVGAQETIATIFAKNNDNQSHVEESFLADTANKMIKMGDNYTKILDSSAANMAKITLWGHELAEKTMRLLSEFQFQDISRQQIEQVIKALERRKEYSQKLRDVLLDSGKDYQELEHFSLDSLRADYVMATQHQVHTQQLGLNQEAPVAVPLIELF